MAVVVKSSHPKDPAEIIAQSDVPRISPNLTQRQGTQKGQLSSPKGMFGTHDWRLRTRFQLFFFNYKFNTTRNCTIGHHLFIVVVAVGTQHLEMRKLVFNLLLQLHSS